MKERDNKGFTIVEVMIVLAIAGLVMAVVFVAVPALQRNQRNGARQNDLGYLRAQFQQAVANENGKPSKDNFQAIISHDELSFLGRGTDGSANLQYGEMDKAGGEETSSNTGWLWYNFGGLETGANKSHKIAHPNAVLMYPSTKCKSETKTLNADKKLEIVNGDLISGQRSNIALWVLPEGSALGYCYDI